MVETLIILFGLAWGSFLNVVIYRLPHGMNLALPPSHCPHCQTRIKLRHNIPVFSWLMLGGQCRTCKARIPVTYVLVEALTPLCFLILYLQFGLSLHFFISCIFTGGLIALCFIDFFHQILPDEITLPGLVLGLVYTFFRDDFSLRQALFGAVLGAAILLTVYGTYYLLRKREGLGMGDVTLMLMIGAFLGWRLALLTLILGSFLGALVGVYVLTVRKKDLQFALPFGTFLTPAAYVALVWGDRVIAWYLGMFPSP